MDNVLNNIYNNLQELHNSLDKKMQVSEEDEKLAKNSKYYQIINYIKRNRKLIGTILIILMIWYYFNYLSNTNHNISVQTGGSKFGEGVSEGYGKSSIGQYRQKLKARSQQSFKKEAGKSVGKATGKAMTSIGAAPRKAKEYASRKVDAFKAMSGQIYMVLFQIALFVMMFLVLGPAIFVGVAMIVCFSLLEKKMQFIKKL